MNIKNAINKYKIKLSELRKKMHGDSNEMFGSTNYGFRNNKSLSIGK